MPTTAQMPTRARFERLLVRLRPVVVASLSLLNSNPAIAQLRYEFSAVAPSADQSPAIDFDASNARLCIELSRGRSPQAIAREMHWTMSEIQVRIHALENAQLLQHDKIGYTPTFLTVDGADAVRMRVVDPALSDQLIAIVEGRQPQLQENFMRTLHIDAQQANALSLFALGDVLFDRWQVRNVRSDFLPGYPSPRAGRSFYLLASEDQTGTDAALGFYSHAESRHGDTLVVTFGKTHDADPFAAPTPQQADQRVSSYLSYVQGHASASPDPLDPTLIRDGNPQVPSVSQVDYAKLPEITEAFRVDLMHLLMADRPKIVAAYESSRYARYVSFQEFALWWYHFLYADVIDRLIANGAITVPKSGYAALIVLPEAVPHKLQDGK